MRKVCGHTDWDARRDHPLLELEGLSWGDSRTAVHRAVAQAISTCQSPSTKKKKKLKLKFDGITYRRVSLINACRYGTFSNWAQVGFV